jgi:hypothetical protein
MVRKDWLEINSAAGLALPACAAPASLFLPLRVGAYSYDAPRP